MGLFEGVVGSATNEAIGDPLGEFYGGVDRAFGGMFKAQDPYMMQTGRWNPRQRKVSQGLSDLISGGLGEGLRAWEGGFQGSLSDIEQTGLGQLRDFIQNPPDYSRSRGLLDTLEGYSDPEQIEENFMEFDLPRLRRLYDEELDPLARETFAGGEFGSTFRQQGQQRAVDQYGSLLLDAREGRHAQGRDLAVQTTGLAQQQAVMETQNTIQHLQAVKLDTRRDIETRELLGQYSEFLRTTPELNPLISAALSYLQLDPYYTTGIKGEQSQFMQLLGAAAPAAGAAAGTAAAVALL